MKNSCRIAMLCLSSLLIHANAWGFNTLSESAEIAQEDTYRLGIQPQIKLSHGGGANLDVFLDRAIKEDMSFRVFTGIGDTDFLLGGSFKWVPFPDFDNQPAIGARIRAQYIREGSENFFGFGFDPIVSKKYEIDAGLITPYVGLPITAMNNRDNTNTSINVVLGTEFKHNQQQHILYGGEIGFDGKDAFSYISGFVTLSFDNDWNWIRGN